LIGVDVARRPEPVEVAPGLTLGDFLFGSMEATRDTLYRRGRDSITLRLTDVSARSLGALIALFERAVGLYAELVDVNAYHQPAVDKFAAAPVVALQLDLLFSLRELEGPCTAEELATAIGRPEAIEAAHRILTRLAADPRAAVGIDGEARGCSDRFYWAHA
jgi:glucose-6-phosphate isomerase